MWINLTPEELKLIRHSLGHETGEDVTELVDKLETWETNARSSLHKYYRNIAFEQHDSDGDVEVDDASDGTNSVVPGERGAYVMAWVWVYNADAGICKVCGDHPGSESYGTIGDAYDDMCPNCADRDEFNSDDGSD